MTTFCAFPFGGPGARLALWEHDEAYLQEVQPRWLRGLRVRGFLMGVFSVSMAVERLGEQGRER